MRIGKQNKPNGLKTLIF